LVNLAFVGRLGETSTALLIWKGLTKEQLIGLGGGLPGLGTVYVVGAGVLPILVEPGNLGGILGLPMERGFLQGYQN